MIWFAFVYLILNMDWKLDADISSDLQMIFCFVPAIIPSFHILDGLINHVLKVRSVSNCLVVKTLIKICLTTFFKERIFKRRGCGGGWAREKSFQMIVEVGTFTHMSTLFSVAICIQSRILFQKKKTNINTKSQTSTCYLFNGLRFAVYLFCDFWFGSLYWWWV